MRFKGVERQEVLATVIAAYPVSLISLEQAQDMTDQVMERGGLVLLPTGPGEPGTSFRDTERHRVPAALVAQARQTAARPDPRATDGEPRAADDGPAARRGCAMSARSPIHPGPWGAGKRRVARTTRRSHRPRGPAGPQLPGTWVPRRAGGMHRRSRPGPLVTPSSPATS
jgi:hypothetical protein